jgi:hypothetical protein
MNQPSIRAQLGHIVSPFVPRNCRQYNFRFYEVTPQVNALGFRADPTPFEGKVIAHTDEALIVQTARTHFAIVDRQLVTVCVDIGTRIFVSPYCRRDFDGERLDKPIIEDHADADGTMYQIRRIAVGGQHLKLPLPPLRCEYLQHLREHIESLLATDGFRTIANLLVDAKASAFQLIDPTRANIIKTPPEISCAVHTDKFAGRVAVIYDRAMDCYVVELRDDSHIVCRKETIFVDALAQTIENLIDDGKWRDIKVEVLKTPRSTKIAA